MTVTDERGCTKSLAEPIVINEPPALLLDEPSVTGASCGEGVNGSVTLSASGGTPPYQYTLDGTTNNTGLFSDLPGGSYEYAVEDHNGCTATGSFVIPDGSDISCSIAVSPNPAVPGQALNTIFIGYGPQYVTLTASASNGTAPYDYDWGSDGTGSSISVNPSVTTTYNVSITDNAGCQATCSITIYVTDVSCGNNGQKVLVCHKLNNRDSKTLCINTNDVINHLSHGDQLGACESSRIQGPGTVVIVKDINIGDNSLQMIAVPNPTSGYFSIQVVSDNTGESIRMRIFDINGQVIDKADHLIPGQIVEVGNNYRPGIYLAELVQGKVRVTSLLMKVEN